MKIDITYLWGKHFGDNSAVPLSQSKSFFEELNEICIEDVETEKEVETVPDTEIPSKENPSNDPYKIPMPLVNPSPKA